MPRKPPTAQQSVQRLQAKGFSNAQIGAAIGAKKDYVRLIGKGAKPGNLNAAALQAANSRARTGRALKPVENAPRRNAPRRTPTKMSAGPGRTLYEGKSAGQQLFDRIFAAGRKGQTISLTIVWKEGMPSNGSGPSRKTPLKPFATVLFDSIDAFEAIDTLDAAGWDTSHVAALENIATQSPTVEYVKGLQSYQLLTRDARDEVQWEDA
jgi:hypothetical protein